MQSKLLTRLTLVLLVFFSCTKQIDDSILDVDIEEILIEEAPILSTENSIYSVEKVYLNGQSVEVTSSEVMEADKFIRVVLPAGSNVSSVSIDFQMSENASLASSISGLNFTGTGIKLISVVAENGEMRTYALKVSVIGGVTPLPSPNAILGITSIIASGTIVNPVEPVVISDNTIPVLLPADTPLSAISFEFEITENSFLLDTTTNLNFESGATNEVDLQGEDEEIRTYTIIVELEDNSGLSDENEITGIIATIGEAPNATVVYEEESPVFDASNSIILEVPFKTPIDDIDLELELSEFATLEIGTITTGLDFTGAEVKTFIVVAQNGSEYSYEIEVKVADPTEREALIEMYNNRENRDEEYKWDLSEGSDIGLWTGVSTNDDGNVISINHDNDGDSDVFSLNGYLKYLPFLKSISANENGLGIPTDEEMEGAILENLESITSDYSFTSFPEWFANLPNLRTLIYNDEEITNAVIRIPDNIGNLKNSLEFLAIDGPKIESLPESMKDLESLVTLELNWTGLETLPAYLAELPNLKTLDVTYNSGLTSIPQAICDWGEMDGHTLLKDDTTICEGEVSIDAQKAALLAMYNDSANWSLDEPLENWENIIVDTTTGNVTGYSKSGPSSLETISVYDDNFKDLPYLKTFNVSYSSFENNTIPPIIFELTQLEELSIGYVTLDEIATDISKLTNLTKLTFYQTSLETIPSEIANLENLTSLDIRFNNIATIPQAICDWGEETGNTLFKDSTTLCDGSISGDNILTSLSITNTEGVEYVLATIDLEEIGINIEVPFSTDITNLNVAFSWNEAAGATSDTASPQTHNFEASALIFEIAAQNGDQREYTITFAKAAMTQREAVLSMYNHELATTTGEAWDLDAETGEWPAVTVVGENVTGLTFHEKDYLVLNENLGVLTELQFLDLNWTDLPETINGELNNLETIESYEMSINSIPTWVFESSGITSLTLESGYIDEIPDSIGDLINLKILNLYENRIASMSSNIGLLKDLTEINLLGSKLETIPDEIGTVESLEILMLENNLLNEVPVSITNLSALKTLDLGSNSDLTYLPQEICDFGATLDTFRIDDESICSPYTAEIQAQRDALLAMYNGNNLYNGIEDVYWSETTSMALWPGVYLDGNGNVRALYFDADVGPISNFNNTLGDLIYLERIVSQDGGLNFITDLNLTNTLENLTTIQIETDTAYTIPNWVFDLPNLNSLHFGDVGITEIPDEIGQITSLTSLTFNDDNISKISEEVGDLSNLKSFTMYNNVQVMLPANLCERADNDPNFALMANTSEGEVICGGVSIEEQKSALLAMYNNNSNWNIGSDLADWTGVTTDETTGNVTGLNVNFNVINLDSNANKLVYLNTLTFSEGSLPDDNDITLVSLENLNIYGGQLSYIPEWVYDTVSLKSIRYSDSALEVIDLIIYQLSNLQYLTIEDGTPIREVSERLGYLNSLIAVDLASGGGALSSVPQRICDLRLDGVTVTLDSSTACE